VRWLKDWAGLRGGVRQRFIDMASPADRPVFYDLTPEFQAAARVGRLLYTPTFANRIREGCEFDVFGARDSDSSIDVATTRRICESYLAENGLAQLDRLGMASSVEARQPLVDYRLVEVVTGLRKHQSDVSLAPKAWLHDAVKDVVPEFVLRRPKRGFTPPWRQWAHARARHYNGQLANGYLVGNSILNPASAAGLANRLDVSPWGVPSSLPDYALSLELWCTVMESSARRAPASVWPQEHQVVPFKSAAKAL
jgi:asparagine synthase (glutamine-hydrolysing)